MPGVPKIPLVGAVYVLALNSTGPVLGSLRALSDKPLTSIRLVLSCLCFRYEAITMKEGRQSQLPMGVAMRGACRPSKLFHDKRGGVCKQLSRKWTFRHE